MGASLEPGAVVGPYALERRLGAGGFGAVWLARHTGSTARHALKLLPADDPEFVARVAREAEALGRIEGHPSLVRVHACFREGPYVVLAMELVEGEDLQATLRRRGPLEPREAALLVREVARGLARAHALGVLHRDLKPANVMVGADGRPRVIDFGLARLADARSLTGTGELLGTPAAMAPEQARGLPADERTDVFGLGGLLFTCLTGRALREGTSALDLLRRAAAEPPPALRSVAPGVPAGLAAVADRALALRPEARFEGADALARALDGWLAGGSTGGSRPRAALVAAVALALFAFVALGAAGLLAREVDPRPVAEALQAGVVAWSFGLGPAPAPPPEAELRRAAARLRDAGEAEALAGRLEALAQLVAGRRVVGDAPGARLAAAAQGLLAVGSLADDAARRAVARAQADLAGARGEPAELVGPLRLGLAVEDLRLASPAEAAARAAAVVVAAPDGGAARAALAARAPGALAAPLRRALAARLAGRGAVELEGVLEALARAGQALGAPQALALARAAALEDAPPASTDAARALAPLGVVARGPPRVAAGPGLVAWLEGAERALLGATGPGAAAAALTFDAERYYRVDPREVAELLPWLREHQLEALADDGRSRSAALQLARLRLRELRARDASGSDGAELAWLRELQRAAPGSRALALLCVLSGAPPDEPGRPLADLQALLALDGALEDLPEEALWEVCERGLRTYRDRTYARPDELRPARAAAAAFARRRGAPASFLDAVAALDEDLRDHAASLALVAEHLPRLVRLDAALELERLTRLRLKVQLRRNDLAEAARAARQLRQPEHFDARVLLTQLALAEGDLAGGEAHLSAAIAAASGQFEQRLAPGTEAAAFDQSAELAIAAIDLAEARGDRVEAARRIRVVLDLRPGASGLRERLKGLEAR